jgi:hypothetical protein
MIRRVLLSALMSQRGSELRAKEADRMTVVAWIAAIPSVNK